MIQQYGHQFKTKQRKYSALATEIQELIFNSIHDKGLNPIGSDDKVIISLLSQAQELCESIAEHEIDRYENND